MSSPNQKQLTDVEIEERLKEIFKGVKMKRAIESNIQLLLSSKVNQKASKTLP